MASRRSQSLEKGMHLPCSGQEPRCRARCARMGLLGVILEGVTKALAVLQSLLLPWKLWRSVRVLNRDL